MKNKNKQIKATKATQIAINFKTIFRVILFKIASIIRIQSLYELYLITYMKSI